MAPQIINIQPTGGRALLEWHARPSTCSRRWIGVCEAMNLSMEADSLDELYSLVPETMHLLFADLLEEGELPQYLADRGWTAVNLPARAHGDLQFNVPWQLVAAGDTRDPERRAA